MRFTNGESLFNFCKVKEQKKSINIKNAVANVVASMAIEGMYNARLRAETENPALPFSLHQ